MPLSVGNVSVKALAKLSSPLGLASKSRIIFRSYAELIRNISLGSNSVKFKIKGQVANGVQPQTLTEALQRPAVDGFITLWTIDLTHLDLGILRFTPTLGKNGKPISFGGNIYLPFPIKADGFDRSTSGSNARPTLTISAKSLEITALLVGSVGLKGAKVTRTRTLARFLDDGEEPNKDAHLPTEIYIINRASDWVAGDYVVEELVNALDLENSYFPKLVMQKNYCQFIYRKFDIETGKFIYSKFAQCPYTGNRYFNRENKSCDNIEDNCSKTLNGCRARFGLNSTLPFLGFPAIGYAR